jgi:hypothetical protein
MKGYMMILCHARSTGPAFALINSDTTAKTIRVSGYRREVCPDGFASWIGFEWRMTDGFLNP